MRAVGTKSVRTEIVPVRLSADPMMLRQVLRNLCDNALRHARETVLVHVGTSDGSAVLRVEDDGNGIAPADRPTIFDRFVPSGQEEPPEATAPADDGTVYVTTNVPSAIQDQGAPTSPANAAPTQIEGGER